MIDKDGHNINTVVIPKDRQQIDEQEKQQLLENLKKIKPEQIDSTGDEIYFATMLKKLKSGGTINDSEFDLDFGLYLLNNNSEILIKKNIGKFEESIRKEMVLKIIEKAERGDGDQISALLTNPDVKKINNGKEIALSLLNHGWPTTFIKNISEFNCLDFDIIKVLKENFGSSLSEIKDLQCFVEKDRKDVALEIIKVRGNPDLSAISTLTERSTGEIQYSGSLTQDFALKILNIDTEHAYKFLSDNIKFFDESTRKEIAMKYIENGHEDWINSDWLFDVLDKEMLKNLIEKNGSEKWFAEEDKFVRYATAFYGKLDKEIADKLNEKGYDFKHYNKAILPFFTDECKPYVAGLIIKAGGKPDLNEIPKEYLTSDFALEIVNIGTEESYKFLAVNIELFDEATQRILALKYIEAGYWTYVDATFSPEVVNCEEIAVSLIDKGLEGELKFRFTCLDTDVINKLKEKGYDFKKLDKCLECFIEKDRKNAALEMIKAGGEPDLCFVPKGDLTKEFVSEIIDMKQDGGLKALSLAIPFFEESIINDVVFDLVNAGGWKYIKNEVLKTKRFDECLNKGFILALLRTVGTTEAGKVLKKFSDLDSEIASIFIKLGELGIVVANLEAFNNLDENVAKSFIDEGYGFIIKKNKERFNLSDTFIEGLKKDKNENKHSKKRSNIFTGLLHSLRGLKLKQREKSDEISEENEKILKELENFQKEWRDRDDSALKDIKEKIIEVADKIPVDVIIDSDGNKIFTLKLKNRTLQILSPRLENYTDEKYKDEIKFDTDYCSTFNFNNKVYKTYVKSGGMQGDDVKQRKNKKLATYVTEKQKEGFHIPSKDEMITVLSELGESAGLNFDDDRKDILNEVPISVTIAMILLMYLTGSPSWYWLSDCEESSDNQHERLMMTLSRFYGSFDKHSGNRSAGILMIK